MKTVNRVFLLGSVGRDPEVRGTGTAVASLSLATNERVKGKDGNWADSTEWHSLVAFGRTAEVIRDYVKKGNQIHIEGRLQTRSWDKDGQKQYRTEIVVEELCLLGGGESKRQSTARPATTPAAAPTWEQVASQGITDDDIPF